MSKTLESPVRPQYRSTLAGDGRPGPIEERCGRRLLRLVEPESSEGLALLARGEIDWLGPDGERLCGHAADAIYAELFVRLERRLDEARLAGAEADRNELEAGLERLREWSSRFTAAR